MTSPVAQVSRPKPVDVGIVDRACRLIEAGEELPTLQRLAAKLRVSPHRLHRAFRKVAGVTPRQYAQAGRFGRLKADLQNGKAVTRALYDAGFGSSRALYERAGDHLGMTPASYRKGGLGMQIAYAIVECPLGRLLVGGTHKGVSAVSLGSSDAALERALREEYPAADLRRGGNHLKDYVRAIVAHLRGRLPHLDLPIDIQATAFRRRVWEQLRKIPYGQTRTYGQIAKAVGEPGAARAVGQACGANPVAIVIPCHRAVRGDGDTGGYRWGPARKAKILESERSVR
jgi:AraC family transcriptional regulator, regulatory protein of adaptative response / methylated-DNA-[protein]-cysteine methyltransferase